MKYDVMKNEQMTTDIIISAEKKIEMFEKVRRLEELAPEIAEGALEMLKVLGLRQEYFRWGREDGR